MTVRLPLFDAAAEKLLTDQAHLLGETVETYIGRAVAYRLLAQMERQGDARCDDLRSAFAATGLLPSPASTPAAGNLGDAKDVSLQGILGLAAEALGVPAGIVAMVGRDRHDFRASNGTTTTMGRPADERLLRSVAQRILETRRPMIVVDAHVDPDLREHPCVADGSLRAFLGFPVAGKDGHIIGAFCVADSDPRYWARAHMEILEYFVLEVSDRAC